jgi:hypothetical protein
MNAGEALHWKQSRFVSYTRAAIRALSSVMRSCCRGFNLGRLYPCDKLSSRWRRPFEERHSLSSVRM